jgi:filamentous hemagglutinin family protein
MEHFANRHVVQIIFFIFICIGEISAPRALIANPSGVISSQGVGSIQGLGTNQVTIQQTAPKGIINWQTFNIASGQVTRFIQPSAQSIILNRINDANPSQIFGSLLANGSVILLNPNGVLFSKGSQVNVNGLIASTLNLADANFLNGNILFEGNGSSGFVKNEGTIQSATGGYIYLFAPSVENNGIIQSPEGQIYLGGGDSVYLSDNPNGTGFFLQVTAPAGTVVNLSRLMADGGQVNLFGAAVSQKGLIQADSVRGKNGKIELYASKKVELAAGSRVEANGGADVGEGGMVSVISDKTNPNGQTLFDPGAIVDISGGKAGGNGGSAEISGYQLAYGGTVVGTAANGYRGGQLLLDPFDSTLTQSDFDNLSTSGLGSVTIQADHDITVNNVSSDLTQWASQSTMNPTLIFSAGHDINFVNMVLLDSLSEGSPYRWNLSATAGNNLTFAGSQIYIGNGGNVFLMAGQDISLQGKNYINNLAGGTITLNAGRNIIAPFGYDADTSSFFGIRMDSGNKLDQIGDITINAGGDFMGGTVSGSVASPGFSLAKGSATVSVGGNFGTADNYAVLTLGSGNINIDAHQNIFLKRVQDKGLIELSGAIVDPANQVKLISDTGDIYLNPNSFGPLDLPTSVDSAVYPFLARYPASFSAEATLGNIYLEGSTISFWPSYTGNISFIASLNIEGKGLNGGLVLLEPDNFDPINVQGKTISDFTSSGNISYNLSKPPAGYSPPSIVIKTLSGDISNLSFGFVSSAIFRNFDIEVGRDLYNFTGNLSVYQNTSAKINVGRDMILWSRNTGPNNSINIPTGLKFTGDGQGAIVVGRNLDLGTSGGIEERITSGTVVDRVDLPGLIDISLGGDLKMTLSHIWTYNGENISIHGLNGPNSPTGGIVDVGINADVTGHDLGIVTLRGGNISVISSGNINVNASRIATLSGGNISLLTVNGSINAGVGSPTARSPFLIATSDPLHPKIVYVPGSGIFTYDDADPNPLPSYPDPPNIFAFPFMVNNIFLEQQEYSIIKESFLGHDLTPFLSKYQAEISPVLNPFYDQIKADFRKDWKLGDISLKAGNSIIIPPAGIRGKKITIDAPNVNLEGGQLKGDVTFVNVQQITGGSAGILGPVSGSVGGVTVGAASPLGGGAASSGSLGGLTGSTGGVSAQVASAAATTSLSGAKTENPVAEANDPEEQNVAGASDAAAQSSKQGGKKKGGGKKFVLKHGVVIEVETEEINENEK